MFAEEGRGRESWGFGLFILYFSYREGVFIFVGVEEGVVGDGFWFSEGVEFVELFSGYIEA